MNKVRARGMHLPLFWGILGVVFFLFLRDPAKTGQWMARGLSVAVYKALPAVFPYLILSSLFFKSGFQCSLLFAFVISLNDFVAL